MWQDLDGLGGSGVNPGAHQVDQFSATGNLLINKLGKLADIESLTVWRGTAPLPYVLGGRFSNHVCGLFSYLIHRLAVNKKRIIEIINKKPETRLRILRFDQSISIFLLKSRFDIISTRFYIAH